MNTVELLERPVEPFKMAIASGTLATLVVVDERLKSSSVPPLKYGEPWHSRTGWRYPAGVQAASLIPRFFLEADRGTCRRRRASAQPALRWRPRLEIKRANEQTDGMSNVRVGTGLGPFRAETMINNTSLPDFSPK
jgi:hypothetical protein